MKKILSLLFSLFLLAVITSPPHVIAETIHIPPEKSREELYQDIFISMLMPKIDEQIANHYQNVLKEPPMVYPYMVIIENAERLKEYRTFEFEISAKVYPVVGPHIEVGLDKFTFYINGSGKVQLTEFQHIKDYSLPDNWKHIKIN